MGWISYSKLNHRNCHIGAVKFVKSTAKRRKLADLYLNKNFWIEAQLHIEDNTIARLNRKSRWSKTKREHFSCCRGDNWERTYCSGVHISVFINDDKIYSKSGNDIREFENPWLLRKVQKMAFV